MDIKTVDSILKEGFKFCECGCREQIPVINKMGNPARFKQTHHLRVLSEESKEKKRASLKGEKSYRWKGQPFIDHYGYVWIWMPTHRFNVRGYVREHRYLWELYHNACLLPWGVPHHNNGIKKDNRKENLTGMSQRQHNQLHMKKINPRQYVKNIRNQYTSKTR